MICLVMFGSMSMIMILLIQQMVNHIKYLPHLCHYLLQICYKKAFFMKYEIVNIINSEC